MAAGKKDITVEIGATFALAWTIQNGDETAFDLTGYTPQAQVRETATSKHPIVEIPCSVYGDPTLGQVYMVLPAAGTLTLKPGNYVWDFFIRSNAQSLRLIQGKALIVATVSR